jgi:hypothetical protein
MRRSLSRAVRLSVVLTAAWTASAAGQGDPVAGGAAFLLLPVGARATALGQAGVADAGTSEAAFWNPAGLADLPSSEFGVQYASTFASRNTALSLFGASRRLGTVGITAYLVDYGTQDQVPPGGGVPTGRVAPKNVQLSASYATDVGSAVSLGVSYKLIQFRQDCQGDCGPIRDLTGTTHAVDVGAQVAIGAHDAFRLGIALQHAGFALQLENRDQADPLPTRLGLGAAYQLPLRAMGASQAVDARVLVDVQDQWGEYGSVDARMGIEVAYGGAAFLRAGYAFLPSGTGGASLGFGLRLEQFAIDLARVFYQANAFDDPVYLGFRILL